MSPSPTVERHQMVGEQVVRAVKSALDSLQRDLPATGSMSASAGRQLKSRSMHDWIDTAYERQARLGLGAAPELLGRDHGDEEPERDERPDWLARLREVFPGGPEAPTADWAGVSRKLAAPDAGAYRVETAPSRIRALGMLAAGVADGWLPVLVVNLRSGEGWRATLICRGDRVVKW